MNSKNQNTFINFPHHICNDIFETSTLNKEQKHIFELLTSTNKGLHTLQGPLGSGKTFFVKYLTHQLQLQGKNVLFLATTRVAALRLSPHACIVHSLFKIPIKGYLTTIIKPSSTLETLKQANLIVIDEMFMMTSIVLCTIEQCLKQSFQNDVNPLDSILILIVGDLSICKHSYFDVEKCCRSCHISMAPSWLNATHHHFNSLMRHTSDPIYL